MSANDFLSYLTRALFVLDFVVLIEAVQRPMRATVDIALFCAA